MFVLVEQHFNVWLHVNLCFPYRFYGFWVDSLIKKHVKRSNYTKMENTKRTILHLPKSWVKEYPPLYIANIILSFHLPELIACFMNTHLFSSTTHTNKALQIFIFQYISLSWVSRLQRKFHEDWKRGWLFQLLFSNLYQCAGAQVTYGSCHFSDSEKEIYILKMLWSMSNDKPKHSWGPWEFCVLFKRCIDYEFMTRNSYEKSIPCYCNALHSLSQF